MAVFIKFKKKVMFRHIGTMVQISVYLGKYHIGFDTILTYNIGQYCRYDHFADIDDQYQRIGTKNHWLIPLF